jgi:glycerol-3-phosphate acyltransferase PlsY
VIAGLYIAVALIGYLLGSIPCGVIISRLSSGTDIRQVGSGKTGMTNVLRASGKKAAALALVLDIAKGVLAVVLAKLIFDSDYAVSLSANPASTMHYAQILAALAAIGGHSWSIFLKFKGGRGVNTFIGGLLAMYWPAAVVGGGIMIIVGFSTRYMSLGSITGAVAAFVMLIILNTLQVALMPSYPPIQYVIYALIGAIFIYVMHHDNIRRLVTGQERKIGEKTETDNLPSASSYK